MIWHSQPGVGDDDDELSEIKSAADRFGVEVMSSGLRNAQDLKNAYANIATIKPNGAITPRNSVTLLNRKQLADFAVKINLPTICKGQDFVHDGCLLSYGSDCYITGGEQLRWIKSLKGPNPLIFP